MIIGLDGSRAFLKQRTGIEEYSYQVIKHLRGELGGHKVRLYVPRKKEKVDIDFLLPENWEVRELWAPRFWTKIRLSLEMFFYKPDVLLVPAHTLPLVGAKKNIVVIHGLEYELCPESYSFWDRLYMRLSIQHSCQRADTLIAVSENTKKDLVAVYKVPEKKIHVVYEGFSEKEKRSREKKEGEKKALLFIGRLETRKNVVRIIEAFEEIKKEEQDLKLLLVGRPGYGYEEIQKAIERSPVKRDIVEMGFVSQEEKGRLLEEASIFLFPSLYEGFGLPILEAQAAGVLVVTSKTSSLPEVAGEGALYVDPYSTEDIAEKLYCVLSLPEEEKQQIRERGRQNKERFSWQQCAKEVAEELLAT